MIDIFDPSIKGTNREHTMRVLGMTENGNVYIYGQASGAIAEGAFCRMQEDGQCEDMDETNPDRTLGETKCVAQQAFSDNEYGWFQVFGVGIVRTAASAAADRQLYLDSTDGLLDDAGTAKVNGINLTTARGGTAGTAPCVMNWPQVDLLS